MPLALGHHNDHFQMNPFTILACEFDLSSAETSTIRAIVTGIGLRTDDERVVESLRSTLREFGMVAFDLTYRASLWSLEISYNDDEFRPDVALATEAIQKLFHVDRVAWTHGAQMPTLEVAFGFTCPEGWCAPLPEALGKTIRTRIKELVIAANMRVSGPNRLL